jgi:uncharacterized membrane protein
VLGRTEAAEIELAKVKAILREHQDLHTTAATTTAAAAKATPTASAAAAQKRSPLSWKAQDAAAAVPAVVVPTLTISPRASAGEVRSCRTVRDFPAPTEPYFVICLKTQHCTAAHSVCPALQWRSNTHTYRCTPIRATCGVTVGRQHCQLELRCCYNCT